MLRIFSASAAQIGRDSQDKLWYFPDMNAPLRSIPTYGLYGDDAPPELVDHFHAETIAVRSRLYDWEISPHSHPALFQILFVAEGELHLRLGEDDRATAGPLIICSPCGTVHGFRFSSNVTGFVVTVSRDFVDSLVRQDALRVQIRKPSIHQPGAPLTARLLALGEQLVEAERDRFDPHVHRLHHALAEAWLRTAIQPGLDERTQQGTLAQRFQSLVETGYREHYPLAHYADRLNCTIRTLSRQTEAAFGMTPLQLINRRMLFEARRLLRFTNASCSQVAAELGFEDPSYFSRFYRRMTGASPSTEKARSAD